MLVEVSVTINGSTSAVWSAMTDIEHAADFISGIEKIEIVHKPVRGLVGLRWRETRILFGDSATVEKWITDATDKVCYKTRAESDGFVFLSTTSIAERDGVITLRSVHDSQPQTLMRKLVAVPMMLLFQGVAKKALRKDLIDIPLRSSDTFRRHRMCVEQFRDRTRLLAFRRFDPLENIDRSRRIIARRI